MKGVKHSLRKGQGWYDHEFGGKLPEEGQDRMNYAWNWAAVQLDNMHEITAAKLIDPEDGRLMETRTVVIDPKGRKTKPVHMELIPSKPWTSVKTFRTYPACFNLAPREYRLNVRG